MSDIDTVKAIYQAMGDRDFDKIFELIDVRCVQTQDERLPWGGRHEGQDGFATFGLTLTSTIDSTVEIEALFEADGEVIQVGRTRGTVVATGVPFDIPEVHRWKIEDGTAVRAHFAIDTPAMLDRLAQPAPG
jgi:ketosteroid isomerase-like protein